MKMDMNKMHLNKNMKKMVNKFSRRKDTGTKNFVSGMAIGLGVGVLASMLFAPQSGRATRNMIGTKTHDLGQNVKDTFSGTVDKTERLIDKGREQVRTALHRGERELDAMHEQGRDYARQADQQLTETLNRPTGGY